MKNPLAESIKYNQIAVTIVVGLFAMLVVLLAFIRPAWGSLKSTNAELSQVQQERDQLKVNKESLEKVKSFFDDQGNRDAINRVITALPLEPGVPNILALLENLSTAHGVSLTSFSPQQISATSTATTPLPAQGTSAVDISANYKGDYNNLLAFFYDLESSQRIVDVQLLSVATEQGSNTIAGSVTFRAYYLPPPSNTTSGGTS